MVEKIEELEEILYPILNGIKGVDSVSTNDYDAGSISFLVCISSEEVDKDLRGISGQIRKTMTKLGLKSSILTWEAPIKRHGKWGEVEVDTDYFYIEIDAGFEIKCEPIFEEDWYIFDKYDYLGSNNHDLERIFMDTYKQARSEVDHIEIMNRRYEFGKNYELHLVYKYEHGEINYELSPSCRWDSCVVGVMAIKEEAKITFSDIIEDINTSICIDYEDEDCA